MQKIITRDTEFKPLRIFLTDSTLNVIKLVQEFLKKVSLQIEKIITSCKAEGVFLIQPVVEFKLFDYESVSGEKRLTLKITKNGWSIFAASPEVRELTEEIANSKGIPQENAMDYFGEILCEGKGGVPSVGLVKGYAQEKELLEKFLTKEEKEACIKVYQKVSEDILKAFSKQEFSRIEWVFEDEEM